MFLSSLAVAGLKDSPSLSDKRKVGRENLSRAHWSLLPFPRPPSLMLWLSVHPGALHLLLLPLMLPALTKHTSLQTG